MLILICFYYAAVLLVGMIGGLVVQGQGKNLGDLRIQWWIVLFPMVLAFTIIFKPVGPHEWFVWIPNPSRWDYLVVAVVFILVTVRGVWEIIHVTIDWTRILNRSVPGAALMNAHWLGYQAMANSLGLEKLPEIRFHRFIKTPFVIGWLEPRIIFPAALVPNSLRNEDSFWIEVDFFGLDQQTIQKMIFHELSHVKASDHLRLAVLALNACLIPWEWIVGKTDLEKSVLTRNRVFRFISRIFRIIGYPYSKGLEAERAVQESGAQSKVEAIVMGRPHAARHSGWRNFGILEVWRETIFTAVCLMVLVLAPGISAVRFAVDGNLTNLSALPETWCLKVEPAFGKATAGLIPGNGQVPGRIFVNVTRMVPWHWPQLKAVGRLDTESLPLHGWIDLTWDMTSEDNVLKPLAVHLLLAEVPIVESARQEAYTLRADPSEPPRVIGRNRYRYHRRIRYGDLEPHPSWIYIDYYFQDNGRWVFDPPVLTFITDDGRTMPLDKAHRELVTSLGASGSPAVR